jgi:hypothetical protein
MVLSWVIGQPRDPTVRSSPRKHQLSNASPGDGRYANSQVGLFTLSLRNSASSATRVGCCRCSLCGLSISKLHSSITLKR